MTQLLYLVPSVASNGTSVSLNASALSSSLNPGVVNGFTLLFYMSDVWLNADLPPTIGIRPNRHNAVQQLSVAFTVIPKTKSV